jgi:hypothetical protein
LGLLILAELAKNAAAQARTQEETGRNGCTKKKNFEVAA